MESVLEVESELAFAGKTFISPLASKLRRQGKQRFSKNQKLQMLEAKPQTVMSEEFS